MTTIIGILSLVDGAAVTIESANTLLHIIERLPIICVALVLDFFYNKVWVIINLVFIVNLKYFDGSGLEVSHLKALSRWGIPYFGKVGLNVKDLLLELAKIADVDEALLVLLQFLLLHFDPKF